MSITEMGYFSWLTNDTVKDIYCRDCLRYPTFRVYMKDHLGNVWIEENYEGFGVFGEKDFYVLLAEMNEYQGRERKKREFGVNLFFRPPKNQNVMHPYLCENESSVWKDERPQESASQGGVFYIL